MNYPKLPHNLKHEYVYQTEDMLVIVARTETNVFHFYWKGGEDYVKVMTYMIIAE